MVTISVGVGTCKPGEQCSSGDMIRVADRAPYQAKHRGRNRVELDTEADAAAVGLLA
ncbi:MAG: GGDEF domain-containing protein [Gammaproteobacteria bacterium]|nr:GGDEF domain-containing protein [Gammaproteobacteria bacterium]